MTTTWPVYVLKGTPIDPNPYQLEKSLKLSNLGSWRCVGPGGGYGSKSEEDARFNQDRLNAAFRAGLRARLKW